jgi:peptidyl-prolyl cis-trans isomerase C
MSTAQAAAGRCLLAAAIKPSKEIPINPNGSVFMTVKARIRRGGAAVALAALLAVAALPQSSFAAEPAPDTVVARVDGAAITEADLAQAALDFRDQIAQVPENQRRDQLMQHLIDTKLAARAAETEGLDKNPEVQNRLQTVRDRTLQLEYVRAKVLSAITDEVLQKRYDEAMKDFKGADQYQAAHMLVKTEDEAKAIIADLDKGGDFAAIAKEKSLDTGSAAKGGELGFFDPQQMVKPFADAVMALTVGSYTKAPVQSQFGWHVIKLEATRKAPPPAFADVAPQIRQQMINELFATAMQDLRAKAKIEIVQAAAPAPTTPAAPAAPTTPAAPAVPTK